LGRMEHGHGVHGGAWGAWSIGRMVEHGAQDVGYDCGQGP
jgi:hypothetical protein